MTSVHEEITRKYKIDGLFTNRWAGSGMCYCESCEHSSMRSRGLAAPNVGPARSCPAAVHCVAPAAALRALAAMEFENTGNQSWGKLHCKNAGGGALSDLDMKTIGKPSRTLFADRQGRNGRRRWENGKNGKEYRATMGNKAIVGIFSVGVETKYRWKDSVQNGNELRLWVADGIAERSAAMVYKV